MSEPNVSQDRFAEDSPRATAMQATLEAGKKLLRDRGPSITLSNVPLEEVINLSGAPRASVYRAWQSYGDGGSARDNFHEALACYLLEEELAGGTQMLRMLEDRFNIFLEQFPNLGVMALAERQELFRQAIAQVAFQAVQNIDSKFWHARIAVAAAIACQPDNVSDRLKAAYLRGEREGVSRYQPVYRRIAKHFGVRIKPKYTMDHFATTVIGLAEGIRARDIYVVENVAPFPEPWGLFNTAVLGVVLEYFEGDPDHAHPTPLVQTAT